MIHFILENRPHKLVYWQFSQVKTLCWEVRGSPHGSQRVGLCIPVVVAMTADPKNPNSERLRLIREALEASLPLRLRIALPRDLDELAEDVLEAEGDDALSASAELLSDLAGSERGEEGDGVQAADPESPISA